MTNYPPSERGKGHITHFKMLKVAIIGRHAGSQALSNVCHGPVDVVLWQFFPDGLQSDF